MKKKQSEKRKYARCPHCGEWALRRHGKTKDDGILYVCLACKRRVVRYPLDIFSIPLDEK
jgi:DNA-directed RNA polymerase subunit RPC12/RpoP